MVMSLLRGKFLGKPETRVLVLGLDESGTREHSDDPVRG